MRVSLIPAFLFLILSGCGLKKETTDKQQRIDASDGMRWIPGGEFIMGTNDPESYETERPAHRVRVKGFWMDETEVTNAQFSAFVEATKYVTMAERKPVWEELQKQLPPGTPKPPDSLLVAGSLVFVQPTVSVTMNDFSQWWKWTPGADWRHPEGPHSTIKGKDNHPVVHIAYEDALAYCEWADKRLPTEAEWEFASRGGADQDRYSWGSEFNPKGKWMANTFQGSFPVKNVVEDGFEKSSPVKSFEANEYGLYDMIGNVWEWTSDWYDANYFQTLAVGLAINPQGPEKPFDPNEPYAMKRVTKGGSYLCSSNYCVNYRPSARQGTSFDSGMSNVGFRCVRDGN
jgi:formylglycine-generating enzyme